MINSVQFNWNIEEFDALVRSCEKDDGVRLALKYLSKDARILEAGCGVGRVVRYLQDWGYDIEGSELNASIVKQVIDRFPDMRIRQGNILHIPVSDEYYGGLLSYGVVEHFTQGPDEALREMFRVLQPGGVAVVTVPAFNALRFLKYWIMCVIDIRKQAWFRKLYHKQPVVMNNDRKVALQKGYRYHVYPDRGDFFEYRFTPREFIDSCRRNGFDVIASIPISHWDGLYQEFGKIMCDFRNWMFHPTFLGKIMNTAMRFIPLFHNHMYACILKKPYNDTQN